MTPRGLGRAAVLPVRATGRVAATSYRAGVRAGRLVGYRRLALLLVGVVIGLLVAPVPGRELRARLVLLLRRRPSDDDLREAVGRELAEAPRTWHLPQPTVEVSAGVVTLRGEVPHETARRDLEQAAASIDGVARVESLLVLSAPPPG